MPKFNGEEKRFVGNLKIILNKDNESDNVVVATKGKWKGHNDGAFEIGKRDIEDILKNFEDFQNDLLFDYDHESYWKSGALAAGWGTDLKFNDKTGQLSCRVDWTKDATTKIQNKEIRYVSPTFIFNRRHPVTGANIGTCLDSVAITNHPFLRELPPIRNTNTNINNHQKGGFEMNDDKIREVLIKLNVSSENEILTKFNSLNKENEKLNAKIETLEVNNATITKNNEELQVKLNENEIALAIAENKFKPAQKEFATKLMNKDREIYDDWLKNQTGIPEDKINVKENFEEDVAGGSKKITVEEIVKLSEADPKKAEKLEEKYLTEVANGV